MRLLCGTTEKSRTSSVACATLPSRGDQALRIENQQLLIFRGFLASVKDRVDLVLLQCSALARVHTKVSHHGQESASSVRTADQGNDYVGKACLPSVSVKVSTSARGAECDAGCANQRLPILFRYRLGECETPIAFYYVDSAALS